MGDRRSNAKLPGITFKDRELEALAVRVVSHSITAPINATIIVYGAGRGGETSSVLGVGVSGGCVRVIVRAAIGYRFQVGSLARLVGLALGAGDRAGWPAHTRSVG